jgi:hypothetical protein
MQNSKIAVNVFFLFLLLVSARGQAPPVGIIDFYGLRTVSESQVRGALQLKEGGNLPSSRKDVEKRLAGLPNVERARLNAICCEAGKLILYIGIQEKGASILKFRPAPRGKVVLPEEIIKVVNDFYKALSEAVQKGEVEEDDSSGHSLMKNAEVRAAQEKFLPLANRNLPLLRQVLYRSSNAEHRAFAAQLIAYYDDKNSIVKDLVYGMSDENEAVRNSSIRALGVLARYALNSPKKKISVPAASFIDLLNSLEWTDRNKASLALWQLTEKRDRNTLLSLRKNALESLIEMSRWKTAGHALSSFVLLARIGGVPEDEIMKLWESGEREKVISMARQE